MKIWSLLPLLTSGILPCFGQVPANDNFASRIMLTGDTPILVSGTTSNATAEADEPDHALSLGFSGNQASNSVWWEWTSSTTGTVSIVTTGSTHDLVLSIYTGNDLATLTEVATADFFPAGNETTRFAAVSGQTYLIAVDGFSSTGAVTADGLFNLVVDIPNAENDLFENRIVLNAPYPITSSSTTIDATIEPGEPDHANALPTSTNLASNSVWWEWTPAEAGVYVVSSNTDHDTALSIYTGTNLNDLTVVSEADLVFLAPEGLTVEATAGTTYYIAVDGFSVTRGSATTQGSVDLSIFLPPVSENDLFENAITLSGLPSNAVNGTTIGATAEANEPAHGVNSGGNLATNSLWYRWTAPVDAYVGFATLSNGLDRAVAVYTGTDLSNLVAVTASDIRTLDGLERADLQVTAGTEYFIAIDGFGNTPGGGSLGNFSFAILEVPINDLPTLPVELVGSTPAPVEGTVVAASADVLFGEPEHDLDNSQNLATNSVWYRWTAESNSPITIQVEDPTFDAVLAVYTGVILVDYIRVASANAGGANEVETLTFDAIAGTTYQIAVDGFFRNGDPALSEGTFTLSLGSADPYAAWIAGFPGITGDDAGPNANPSGDGIPNRVKLALGLNPTLTLTNDPNQANYPAITNVTGDLTVEYVVVPENLGSGSTGLTHVGQVSSNLDDWDDVTTVELTGNRWSFVLTDSNADAKFARIIVRAPTPQ